MENKVLPLSEEYLGEISSLHLAYLPTHFHGKAGKQLLLLYYDILEKNLGGTGFVEVEDRKVAGFVCGVWNSQEIKRELFHKHWIGLCFWGVMQLITNPEIIRDLLQRFSKPTDVENLDGYELRPIVVNTGYRGKGVALRLLQALLQDAKERQFSEIHLYTEFDNESAIRFYRKAGFTQKGIVMSSGNKLLFFSIDVTGGR